MLIFVRRVLFCKGICQPEDMIFINMLKRIDYKRFSLFTKIVQNDTLVLSLAINHQQENNKDI